jgi:hypothetical protein
VPSLDSAQVEIYEDSPTDETLARGIELIHGEGLAAILQPYVEPQVEDVYAGLYDPDDPDAFFAAYEERLAAYAGMGADIIFAGSMLTKLDGPEYSDRWRAMLADTRERCSCLVTYAAEGLDRAAVIDFWDAADGIGIVYHQQVADEPTTDPAALARAWEPSKRRMQRLSEEWGKPVLLAELGYQSKADQAAAWAYDATGEPSEQAQAALYEAAFRALRGAPWLAGIAWIELSGDGAQPEPDDFSFAGKQAEQVLRAWQTAR